MGFNRQEYWIELPFLPPEDFPNPGIKPMSPAFASGFFTTVPPGKPTLCQFHPTIIITNKISTPTFLRWPLTSGTSSIEKCWSSSWQDEALARDGVSREVPCSALKGETVPDSLPATPKSPPTRRVPPSVGSQLLDQGSNLYSLELEGKSQPLDHQGSPILHIGL